MAQWTRWLRAGVDRRAIVHAARTAVGAVASFLVARLIGMPEAYWAAISTLVVMQSTLGAAFKISAKRFAGTAIGCAFGAALSTWFGPNVAMFGTAVFVLGVLCATLHLDQVAYRFAGIALCVVMLVVRTQDATVVAIHRFIEVSIGIAAGLALTAVWPERDP